MQRLCERPLSTPAGAIHAIRLGPEYGSLDEVEFARTRHCLFRLVDQSTAPVLALDFSSTSYFGAAFVGLLVETSLRLQKQRRRLLLRGLSLEQRRLLRLMKATGLLAVDRHRDLQEQPHNHCGD